MTHYEVFKEATPDQLATLLTILACGILDEHDPQEIRNLHNTFKDFLADEAPQTIKDLVAKMV